MSTRSALLAIPMTLALAGVAAGQAEVRTYGSAPARAFSFSTSSDDGDRAVIGVTTSTGSARDTLGILLSSVTAGGPADKAGIEEGSRVAAINGVNLKLAAADVGDWDMSSALARRFTREMAKVKAGDEVELRVYMGGQTKTVKIKTMTYDDLYNTSRRATARMRDEDDRAVLGVSLGSTGSKRDTLGVLIMGVDDAGPAAKAGIEEGNRVQSINGVDLKVSRDDAGDDYMGNSKMRRLQRELEKAKVGDEVTLKVYQGGGRVRDIKVKLVKASDLPNRGGFTIFGGQGMPMTITTPRLAPAVPFPQIEMNLRRRQEEDGVLRERIQNQVRERLQDLQPTIRRVIQNRIVL